MVAGTAIGLLFVYGAQNLDNREAQAIRGAFWDRLFEVERWRWALQALTESIGVPLVILGGISVILLITRKNIPYRWLLLGFLVVAFLLFALVPIYTGDATIYRSRYTQPTAILFILGGIATIVPLINQQRSILKWIVISLPVLWLIPATIAQMNDLTRPHTYALAQAWFEENAPAETLLWVEGYETNRSLSRYEAGYSGFNTYITIYASDVAQGERTWDGDFEQIDYIFLNEHEKQTWSLVDDVPPLADLPLIKQIGDSSLRGSQIIYLCHRTTI